MSALAFLIIGLACALIGRVLLIGAAFRVSVGWGLGVLLPFGPLFFRLNHPEAARRSRLFRMATIPLLLLYTLLGPSPLPTFLKALPARPPLLLASGETKPSFVRAPIVAARTAVTAAVATRADADGGPAAATTPTASAQPTPAVIVNLGDRRAASATEFARLRQWNEALRLRKRDLLHSDVAGGRAFDEAATAYNLALAKANAEKATLATAK